MRSAVIAVLVALVSSCVATSVEAPAGDGPRYADGTNLVFPNDYRDWAFLSAGLSMTYEEDGVAATPEELRRFQNVFVNPSSYRYFKENGAWPDGTVFVLEIRDAATDGSINKAGRFQTDLVSLEAEVKDSRFPDGWAFFNFGRAGEFPAKAAPLEGDDVKRCIDCHTEHTAVERTFVQFYPTLLEVARQKGTLNPDFE